jgi:hypothetical protein
MFQVREGVHFVLQALEHPRIQDHDGLLPVPSLRVQALQDDPENQRIVSQTAADEKVLGSVAQLFLFHSFM